MNQLSTSKRKQVVMLMVEGVAINAIVRLTGVSKPTILKRLERGTFNVLTVGRGRDD